MDALGARACSRSSRPNPIADVVVYFDPASPPEHPCSGGRLRYGCPAGRSAARGCDSWTSSGRKLGPHAPLIQVGTPSRGSTQICSTSQAPSRAGRIRYSIALLPYSILGSLITSLAKHFALIISCTAHAVAHSCFVRLVSRHAAGPVRVVEKSVSHPGGAAWRLSPFSGAASHLPETVRTAVPGRSATRPSARQGKEPSCVIL